MPARHEEKLKTLPIAPGVYFHKSQSGEIIYVGKAANLRSRVRQYFQNAKNHDVKTRALVQEIYDTDWVETESEIDALFLESEMVKRYKPRYNVLLRDDKSQLFVRIDMKSEWPHVSFTRNPGDDGAEYYGPFYNGVALKKALRYLRKIFPYLTKPIEKRRSKLEEDLGLSPSIQDGSDGYKKNLRKLISYIKGNRVAVAREIEQTMKEAADRHDFEAAMAYRGKLYAMHELQRRVMFSDREFLQITKDKALNDLSELLMLPKVPQRIEGYDISHMSGSNVVASMVVFTNGVSDRSEYRKFKAKLQANDDTRNMYETLVRRLSEKNIRSWGVPDLILIDGGKGQLSAAARALSETGHLIPLISIAKREEELLVHMTHSHIDTARIIEYENHPIPGVHVHRDGDVYVVNLHEGKRNAGSHSKNLGSGESVSPFQDVVKLFQRIRDESHRFAVSYHTVLKRQKQTASALDDIPGIGAATRKKLLSHFGSVSAIRRASETDLASVVSAKVATAIKLYL